MCTCVKMAVTLFDSKLNALPIRSFSATVSGVLRNELRSFVVDNRNDLRTLQALAKQAQCDDISYYTMSFAVRRHNIRPNMEPPANLTTIKRILTVRFISVTWSDPCMALSACMVHFQFLFILGSPSFWLR